MRPEPGRLSAPAVKITVAERGALASDDTDGRQSLLFMVASRGLYLVGGALMLCITAVILYTVVMRYFFGAPPPWGEALALLLFAWLACIGAAHATITGGNIAVEVVLRSLPVSVQRFFVIVYTLLSIAFLVLVAWKGIPLFRMGFRGQIFGLGIPPVFISGALFVAIVVMILAQLRWLWRQAVLGDLRTTNAEGGMIE